MRAAAYSQSVWSSKTGVDAVLQTLHILSNFDISKDAVREREKDEHGHIPVDYTPWARVNDLKAKRFHFRTYENSRTRVVDLMKMNLVAKDIITISMKGDEVIQAVIPRRGVRPKST